MYTNDRNHSGIFGVVFFYAILLIPDFPKTKKAPFGAFRYYLFA